MEERKEYKLGDVCTKIGSGATPKGGKEVYLGGDTSLIRSQNVLDFSFSWDGLAYINDDQATKLNGVEVEENDVLLNITGDSVARACVVPKTALPARVNQHVSIIRGDNSKVYNEFILYFLQYNKQHLLVLSQGGGTRNALTKRMMEDLIIALPDLPTQGKIISILKSLDDKIEVNRRINDNLPWALWMTHLILLLFKRKNDNLEQQAQALFKSWFVDFEPFKDGGLVESELGMIPKGWKVGKLGELCQFKRGKNLLSKDAVDGGIPVVAGGLEPSCYHNVSNTKSPVVTVSGSGANAGFMRMYHQEVWASDCSFIDSTCDNLLFVYCFLATHRRLLRHVQTGAVQPHVKPADIHDFDIVIPPADVIVDFQKVIAPSIQTKGKNEQESRRLAQLRDTLLPKLMSGELKTTM